MVEPLNCIELPHKDRKNPEKPQPKIHTDLLRRQMQRTIHWLCFLFPHLPGEGC